ncbi:hypothetical protein Y1Q_0023735 [Alligator mississippiensis]|uniref:Uncharacterized protein n=1 Tax=Alligator mississippiensis TaxID=8496 RepID=A0A151MJZ3_ALLMI|nr:hypothetical protein Y1Q_0023735 [Alligator mississippiensis]
MNGVDGSPAEEREAAFQSAPIIYLGCRLKYIATSVLAPSASPVLTATASATFQSKFSYAALLRFETS